MKSVNFNDVDFMQSIAYKEYMRINKATGILSIRAYAANKALPVKGMHVVVFKIIDNTRVIFYDGETDDSGLIENIKLPTPTLDQDDLVKPLSQDYSIEAYYDNQDLIFNITMYANISVNQNINVVPLLRVESSTYGY